MEAIRVIYHREPDGWWAESPDVPGWSAAGATFEEVYALAEDGVRFAAGAGTRIRITHFRQIDELVTG
jgi:predicted RNase H-like HicB family nuclease